MAIFASPPTQDRILSGELSPDEFGEEENLIRVKLFFFCDEKSLRAKVFPEEWYTVMADEYGSDQVNKDFQPWIEVCKTFLSSKIFCLVKCGQETLLTLIFCINLVQFHVNDWATFGEMLLTGLNEANKRFEDMQSDFRFIENIELGEEVYEIMMAKKKTGKPKDDYPSK